MNTELAIECINTQKQFVDDMTREAFDMAIKALEQPDPSQVARDIATIIENEKDMRVIAKNATTIRCKDCEHYHTDECPMTYEEYISWEEDGYIESDNILHDNAEDEGYCHKAERREDG